LNVELKKHWPGINSMAGYKKNWYKEWFGEDYLTVYKHRDAGDARRLIKLILDGSDIGPGAFVLDLACGTGRHAFALAERGCRVLGLDLSRRLLLEARQKMDASQNNPSFVCADMRFFPFDIHFDAIVSLFTSFGYFEDDSQHTLVAGEIARSLKAGGEFVIDYFNPEFVRSNLIAQGSRMVGDVEVQEERWISGGRVHKNIRIEDGGEVRDFHESVRMFELQELQEMLARNHLKVTRVCGSYTGSPFKNESKRMILFARKEKA